MANDSLINSDFHCDNANKTARMNDCFPQCWVSQTSPCSSPIPEKPEFKLIFGNSCSPVE